MAKAKIIAEKLNRLVKYKRQVLEIASNYPALDCYLDYADWLVAYIARGSKRRRERRYKIKGQQEVCPIFLKGA